MFFIAGFISFIGVLDGSFGSLIASFVYFLLGYAFMDIANKFGQKDREIIQIKIKMRDNSEKIKKLRMKLTIFIGTIVEEDELQSIM